MKTHFSPAVNWSQFCHCSGYNLNFQKLESEPFLNRIVTSTYCAKDVTILSESVLVSDIT